MSNRPHEMATGSQVHVKRPTDPDLLELRRKAYNEQGWRLYHESGGRIGWPRSEYRELPDEPRR